MNIEPLACLRRVDGVLGSFVCGPRGQLLLTDMPERHSVDELERTAARLMNLFQAATETMPACQRVRMRFADTELSSVRVGLGLLCILTTAQPDRELLGATAERVARRLSAVVAENGG